MTVERKHCDEDIIIRGPPGNTADEMSNFINYSISRFQPKRLIIFAGCNHIGRAHLDGRPENDVVDSVMRMATKGKNMDVMTFMSRAS